MSEDMKDLSKISHLLSKVSGKELSEDNPLENIQGILNEHCHHGQCFDTLHRKDKKDSWIYDTTALDALPMILKSRLADNLNALRYKISVANDKSDSGYVWQYADGTSSEIPASPYDNDDDYFNAYLDFLSKEELTKFIDDLDHYDMGDNEDPEYPYEDDGCWDEDVVESIECDDLHDSCLNESGLFDIGKFKELSPSTRSTLARNMRAIARSGKTRIKRELNKHRRIVDIHQLIKRARMAAKKMLEKKYMPCYDETSSSAKNNFNKLIHTTKAPELMKDIRIKFKEIRNKELTKQL